MALAPPFHRSRHITEQTPSHYRGQTGLQPIDVIDDWALGFHAGNIIKYVCRQHRKGGLADIKKALHYAQLACRAANLASYPHRGLSLSVTQVIAEFDVPPGLHGVVEAVNTIALSPAWAREQLPRIAHLLAAEISRREGPGEAEASASRAAARLIKEVCEA